MSSEAKLEVFRRHCRSFRAWLVAIALVTQAQIAFAQAEAAVIASWAELEANLPALEQALDKDVLRDRPEEFWGPLKDMSDTFLRSSASLDPERFPKSVRFSLATLSAKRASGWAVDCLRALSALSPERPLENLPFVVALGELMKGADPSDLMEGLRTIVFRSRLLYLSVFENSVGAEAEVKWLREFPDRFGHGEFEAEVCGRVLRLENAGDDELRRRMLARVNNLWNVPGAPRWAFVRHCNEAHPRLKAALVALLEDKTVEPILKFFVVQERAEFISKNIDLSSLRVSAEEVERIRRAIQK